MTSEKLFRKVELVGMGRVNFGYEAQKLPD